LRVSRNFLPVLGFTPLLGRNFSDTEGWNDRVVIISYGAWQRYFGKDPAVLGKRLIGDDIPYTVIGVLPSGFWTPNPADILVPFADTDLLHRNRNQHNFGVIGHLKRGVSLKQANLEMNAIEHQIGEQNIGLKGWETTVVSMSDVLAENVRGGWL